MSPNATQLMAFFADAATQNRSEKASGYYAIAYALMALAEAQDATATALKYLGAGDAATSMGAVEYLATQLRNGCRDIAESVTKALNPEV